MKLALVKEVELTVPHELHIQPQMDADLFGSKDQTGCSVPPFSRPFVPFGAASVL